MCIIDLSLLHLKRALDTQTTIYGYLSTKEQETSCVKHVHIVSIIELSSYINVCVGYMCFVKL